MNLGDKIKQLRAEKNMTQPQLAEVIGIEQSYLSKLENDKSIPSADIFAAVLKGLDVDIGIFLKNIDDKTLDSLKHIPEISTYLNAQLRTQIHNIKAWLFSSAIACVMGLTAIVVGYQSLMFSSELHEYHSGGVLKKGEPYEFFEDLPSDMRTQNCGMMLNNGEWSDTPKCAQIRSDFLSRKDDQIVLSAEYRGKMYLVETNGGVRAYFNRGSQKTQNPINHWLQSFGYLLFFAGVFGFVVEFRLRTIKY